MGNNSTNINKMNSHPSPQLIELRKRLTFAFQNSGPIDASYQVSVQLVKQFQVRRF
jgi:hypothetical protein